LSVRKDFGQQVDNLPAKGTLLWQHREETGALECGFRADADQDSDAMSIKNRGGLGTVIDMS
jgi:hypothetical protein